MRIVDATPNGTVSLRLHVKVANPVLTDLREALFPHHLIDFRFLIHHAIEAHGRRGLLVIAFIGRHILRWTAINLLSVITGVLKVL